MLGSLDFTEKASVLVVDDTPDNVALISGLLRDNYRIRAAKSGEAALKLLQNGQNLPDLILLDIMMPDMDGYEVCGHLQGNPATRDIPIIFLTALSSMDDERRGLELGAVDYITKPINPSILQARVATHLKVKSFADFLKHKNIFLEQEVAKRTQEIAAIQNVTILAMASLAETRDNETGNHVRRTQFYVKALAEHLKTHPRFSAYLSEHMIDILFKSAPLHDIGKVGIPDSILLKPGRFTPEEFEIMKTHTTIGRDAIAHAELQLGMEVDFLKCAKEIAYTHQEKWDGSGYPEGKAGNDIPICGRLMAVADVYDALISRRVYKEGMPHEVAVKIIKEGKGSHFDPDMVDAFVVLADEFKEIASRFGDSDMDMAEKKRQLEQARQSEGLA